VLKDGPDLDGLLEFMSGPFSKMATATFSGEEIARWPQAVTDAVEAEKKEYGGLLMEAWSVVAIK
jgi:hypothetical protein